MKNDYKNGELRISIPPTLLFTVIGVIGNVTQACTTDFKQAGDHIYILGATWKELGASEAAAELGRQGGKIPRVNVEQALARYRGLNALIGQRAISACHDCSDGGFAVALAEMAIGGRLGFDIDIDKIPVMEGMNPLELLYSESASRHIVTIRPDLATLLDAFGMWQLCRRIGEVTANGEVVFRSGDSSLMRAKTEDLARAFKKDAY